MKITREQLTQDPRIQRLLKNPNWAPAAEAAMDFLFEGTDCPIASWRKSSTWQQVEYVAASLEKKANQGN